MGGGARPAGLTIGELETSVAVELGAEFAGTEAHVVLSRGARSGLLCASEGTE
jgi:hypothetical protein